MLASHAWLQELTGMSLDVDDVARKLTSAGIEVESITRHGGNLDKVVIAEVRGVKPHPSRDKLQLVTVFDGAEESEIVCGASNVPAPGRRVVLAQLGAKLPGGIEIAERALGGVKSLGMLCGETELGVGADDSGLLIIEEGQHDIAKPGTPIADALGLRDAILELGLTPNRPDCLGHVGVARELCALYGKPFSLPKVSAAPRVQSGAWAEPAAQCFELGMQGTPAAGTALAKLFRVDIAAPERCPRYGAAFVDGITIQRSPFAVRYRLHLLGLRAISNVVDVTNQVLLLWGHPIHAFDADHLRGSRIEVRLAKAGERMKTLDDVERALNTDDLLICDGEGPVALAGVMGGAGSQIEPTTTRVLIECAYFDPRTVRRTSKRLGMHTDSSHRFERGVDPSAVRHVLADAAARIATLGGGVVRAEALDVIGKAVAAAPIALRKERIAAMLGMPIADADIERILGALGCVVAPAHAGYAVTPPLHRPDLTREIDLIEELARLTGYDHLPTLRPAIRASAEGTPARITLIRRLREAAAAAGLCEAINYAFVAPSDLENARAKPSAVLMQNPMTEARCVMRSSLLPGLAANLRDAQSTQQKSLALFELSRVFSAPLPGQAIPELPHESHQLALILWGQRPSWYREDEVYDFFDAKAAVLSIVQSISGHLPSTVVEATLLDEHPALHPKRSAPIVLSGRPIGALGELHPDVVSSLGLIGRPVLATIDVAQLDDVLAALGRPKARALPRFPASTRDVAVVVAEDVPVGDVVAALAEAAGPKCERVTLFDIYRGDPVPAGHKSLALHVVYRDADATLTDREVDAAHSAVQKAAEARFSASLRR
jgi:phenylalanyl-tRNA synthetase beta chain